MIKKYYDIHRSNGDDFDAALAELLAVAGGDRMPIRIVFFGAPCNGEEFAAQRERITDKCRAYFSDETPMVAYIAQAPLRCTLAAEVTSIAREDASKITRHEDYLTIDGEEVISAGLAADLRLDIGKQAEQIFVRVAEILLAENLGTSDIVRQWNYIEQITRMDDTGQHYQLFNDARSAFYNACKWKNGYPAATGIGTQTGGVTVVFDALRDSAHRSKAIDNPLQISAHAYSQQVLINNTEAHKTTPKFERARFVQGATQGVYISGTAAIRGEDSCRQDAVGQTALTMENIDYLTSSENLVRHGVESPADMEYAIMRAYLKHKADMPKAREWINENYPDVDMLFLWADICREELLIEIEGMAIEKSNN